LHKINERGSQITAGKNGNQTGFSNHHKKPEKDSKLNELDTAIS
jgi:hypothetical protein